MKKLNFELEVYTFHIDIVGHLSNIIYVEWMEIGRIKLLDEMGLPVTELTKKDIFPILVNTNITYKQPIFYGEKVRAEVWISKLNAASAIIEFRFIKNDGILAATGNQKGLFITGNTGKPFRIPNEDRKLFEKFLLEE
ncbi:MAG: thioesterase family protein [Melioribacteraceae bacterium]|nr:thioesterase family protein [Melioribacteraceae bacterium]